MPLEIALDRLLQRHMTVRERKESLSENGSVVGILNALLREGHAAGASDLHLEPSLEGLVVRLRVDGALYDAHHFPGNLHTELLARLKILAGLRTDEHYIPQDGHFRFEFLSTALAQKTIDVRASIIPTHYGEAAVLRLLSSHEEFSSLSSLGFTKACADELQPIIARPHGMILITGPTGSGKSTTLHAFMQLLNTRARSIITIEDPIEYAVGGIKQISLNSPAGLSFAEGLRGVLRQDPDVIGVGEIRDSDTASLATNAALTGHLVLSTLHSIDAATAFPRLLDLGVGAYLTSSTIHLVVSQRLLRRVCTTCRKKRSVRKDQKEKLAVLAQNAVFPAGHSITHHYEAVGCGVCGGTGTLGRIGVFESMPIGAAIREAIARRASAHEIATLATAQGMEPLACDAIRKAAAGVVRLDDALTFIGTGI